MPPTKHTPTRPICRLLVINQNPFKYLMDDVDESSSENNITVTGISRFSGSPHPINKNAYLFTLPKDVGSTQYRSRIGFNIHPLPLGYYTLVVEFFPPEMQNVSVHASATNASITKQTSKTFHPVGSVGGYLKTLVQFHRWFNSILLNYLYLDLHGVATSSTTGRMVVYGVSDWFRMCLRLCSTKSMWWTMMGGWLGRPTWTCVGTD